MNIGKHEGYEVTELMLGKEFYKYDICGGGGEYAIFLQSLCRIGKE